MFLTSERLNFFTPQPRLVQGNTTTLLHFDNSIADSSGYNITWTLDANATYTTTNKFGGNSLAANNASANSYYAITSSTSAYEWGTGDFTVEGWVYRTGTTAQSACIFDSRPNGNGSAGQKRGFVMWVSGGGNCIEVGYSGGGAGYTTMRVTSAGLLSTGAWHHIAYSRSSGTGRIFIDGTQSGANVSDSNNYGYQTAWATPTRTTCIGQFIDASQVVYGYIDEARVSKTARYTANFTAPSAAFVND